MPDTDMAPVEENAGTERRMPPPVFNVSQANMIAVQVNPTFATMLADFIESAYDSEEGDHEALYAFMQHLRRTASMARGRRRRPLTRDESEDEG